MPAPGWIAHWREISDYLLPRSGRFFAEDRNRGERKHNNIYDSTGTMAVTGNIRPTSSSSGSSARACGAAVRAREGAAMSAVRCGRQAE